jgi:Tol biopolymer transport system component
MYMTTSADGQLYTTDVSTLFSTGRTYLARIETNSGIFTRLTRLDIQPHYGNQAHPCIAPDGRYILFDVDGGSHLFVSFLKSDGSWDTAIDLANHGFDIKAGGASISPDGKYLFFHLNGDIWWVDIKVIENLNPFTGGSSAGIQPGFELYQNTPNPCITHTRIAFYLEKPGAVKLDLFSNNGIHIRCLINNQYFDPGKHELTLSLPNLRTGIYNYALSTGTSQHQVRKMIVIR